MTIFFAFLFIIFNAFATEINLAKQRIDEGHTGPDYEIKNLGKIVMPANLTISEPERKEEQESIEKMLVFEQQNAKRQAENPVKKLQEQIYEEIEHEIHDEEKSLWQEEEEECKGENCTNAVTGSSQNGDGGEFCNIYSKELYDVKLMYETQIKKMLSISNTSTNILPQKYLCLAISRIMLINENTTLSNSSLITEAKTDIKTAINYNKQVEGVYKIDIIEGRFLNAIFSKYNEIVLDGMSEEDRQIIVKATSQAELQKLTAQMSEYYGYINNLHQLDVSNAENANLSPHYTANPLAMFNEVDLNGDIETQTQAIRSLRATEEEMNYAEFKIDEMLNVILDLENHIG